MRIALALCGALLLTAGAAHAEGKRPYLQGRFDLDMSKSTWAGGAKPMTGGFWVFEKDDGKTRVGHVVQYAANGRPLVYYYDHVPYDGTMHWLNDWYKESETYIDDNTFSFAWELQRTGMAEPNKGTATCKINAERSVLDCEGTGFHEIYAKKSK